jgi:hypothetical protein
MMAGGIDPVKISTPEDSSFPKEVSRGIAQSLAGNILPECQGRYPEAWVERKMDDSKVVFDMAVTAKSKSARGGRWRVKDLGSNCGEDTANALD